MDCLCIKCQESIDALTDDGLADFLDALVKDLTEDTESEDEEDQDECYGQARSSLSLSISTSIPRGSQSTPEQHGQSEDTI